MRPRRSCLYMPGSNARALEKAKTIPADCIILDLEDAVAPDAKAHARSQVVNAVAAGNYGGREVVVRINGEERRVSVSEEPLKIELDGALESFELDRNFYMTLVAR